MPIISASRRTDIPAFYAEWLMRRLRAGYARWPHLFGGRPMEVSLRPEDVAAIVFWSKDYRPLLPRLDELDARGYRLCFQFTITGLPAAFEPRVPPAEANAAVAHTLARRYGPEAVLWRYDPIVLSSITDADYHRERFDRLAAGMQGATRRCTVSFPCFYGKVKRATETLARDTGVSMRPAPVEEQQALAQDLAGIAAAHGIQMQACCGDLLVGGAIAKAHCIDGALLRGLYPDRVPTIAARPTRAGCGCCASIDIGAYSTCPHGCVYCYANANRAAADRAHASHNPEADMITGPSGLPAPVAPAADEAQPSLPGL